MDDFIRRQNVLDKLFPVDPENDGSDGCTVILQNLTFTSAEIEGLIDQIPSADVAPVVRCKECKYSYKSWLSDILGGIWCTFWQKTQGKTWTMMHFDDFCSHGAKKDLEEQTV